MKKVKMPTYAEYLRILLEKEKRDAPTKGTKDSAGNIINKGRR